MKYKVVYRLGAIQNVREAKAWYRKQRDGLQKEFAESIKDAIRQLEIYPEAFTIRYRNIRIIHTQRFTYNVHFYVDNTLEQVVITNILHDSRYYQTE